MKQNNDTIALPDPRNEEKVKLKFDRIHEQVTKTPGGRYRAASDFNGPDGSNFEVVFYFSPHGSHVHMSDAVIHKIDGKQVLSAKKKKELAQKQ